MNELVRRVGGIDKTGGSSSPESAEINRVPLIFRAHRIPLLNRLMMHKPDPEELAKRHTDEYRNNLHSADKNDRDEAFDNIGPTEKTANANELAMSTLYRWFLIASPEEPLTLLENIPDVVCNACFVGLHCKKRLHEDGIRKEGDTDYLEKFIENARNRQPDLLNDGSIQIGYRYATFSDARPEIVRVIRTTVGVFESLSGFTTRSTIL